MESSHGGRRNNSVSLENWTVLGPIGVPVDLADPAAGPSPATSGCPSPFRPRIGGTPIAGSTGGASSTAGMSGGSTHPTRAWRRGLKSWRMRPSSGHVPRRRRLIMHSEHNTASSIDTSNGATSTRGFLGFCENRSDASSPVNISDPARPTAPWTSIHPTADGWATMASVRSNHAISSLAPCRTLTCSSAAFVDSRFTLPSLPVLEMLAWLSKQLILAGSTPARRKRVAEL